MDRRQWLRRLVATSVAGAPASATVAQAIGGEHAWLRAALPVLPLEPRRLRAYDLRVKAALAAAQAGAPRRDDNADEQVVPAFLAMFSKGLPHDAFGIV
ncbi:MAG TPA: hypothetical protein VMF13_04265, partial [Luteitalea sp.]|nr:hypothetical protein [Luteitalea sp.]